MTSAEPPVRRRWPLALIIGSALLFFVSATPTILAQLHIDGLSARPGFRYVVGTPNSEDVLTLEGIADNLVAAEQGISLQNAVESANAAATALRPRFPAVATALGRVNNDLRLPDGAYLLDEDIRIAQDTVNQALEELDDALQSTVDLDRESPVDALTVGVLGIAGTITGIVGSLVGIVANVRGRASRGPRSSLRKYSRPR